jgi:hypothetical protein
MMKNLGYYCKNVEGYIFILFVSGFWWCNNYCLAVASAGLPPSIHINLHRLTTLAEKSSPPLGTMHAPKASFVKCKVYNVLK